MCMHLTPMQRTSSILDSLGPESTALVVEVSSFQRLRMYHVYIHMWQSTGYHLVPVVCVHYREVSAIRESGLERCLQFGSLD